MSTEPESFLARWSRRKRAAEREAVRPTDSPAPELPAPRATAGGPADAADAPASGVASLREPDAAAEVPLPPIESLDGLRSDYEAFFKQPVDDELRHAALKKLFADPHFNEMDMLDVYVDDYTQFEPLPAALRLRLPSARSFLLDSERAALEADEARTDAAGDEAESGAADPGQGASVAASDPGGQECGPGADGASVESISALPAAGSTTAADAASLVDPPAANEELSGHFLPPGKSGASGPSSS